MPTIGMIYEQPLKFFLNSKENNKSWFGLLCHVIVYLMWSKQTNHEFSRLLRRFRRQFKGLCGMQRGWYIFRHNNAACHTSTFPTKWLDTNDTVTTWAGEVTSFESNQELVRHSGLLSVQKSTPITIIEALEDCILQWWNNIPNPTVRNLYESMAKEMLCGDKKWRPKSVLLVCFFMIKFLGPIWFRTQLPSYSKSFNFIKVM